MFTGPSLALGTWAAVTSPTLLYSLLKGKMTVWTLFTKLSYITLSDTQNWELLDFVTLFTGQDLKHLKKLCLQLKTLNFYTLFTVENVVPPLCLQVKD